MRRREEGTIYRAPTEGKGNGGRAEAEPLHKTKRRSGCCPESMIEPPHSKKNKARFGKRALHGEKAKADSPRKNHAGNDNVEDFAAWWMDGDVVLLGAAGMTAPRLALRKSYSRFMVPML